MAKFMPGSSSRAQHKPQLGWIFQPPLLIHTALILEPHGCTQTHPCLEGLGPRVTRS